METYTITIHESIKLQQRYCFINDNIVTTVHTVKWTIIHFPEKSKNSVVNEKKTTKAHTIQGQINTSYDDHTVIIRVANEIELSNSPSRLNNLDIDTTAGGHRLNSLARRTT